MSSIATFRWSLVTLVAGRRLGVGALDDPTQATIAGVGAMPEQLIVPADGFITVYDFTRDGSFTGFGLEIVGVGYLDLAIFTDKPTSATVLSAAGTAPRWHWQGKSNFLPFLLDSPLVRTSLTANIADWYGPTGAGNPSLIASTNAIDGRIYKIVAHNRDEDAAVTIRRFMTT